MPLDALVATLRAAGCVFAEDEARLLVEAAAAGKFGIADPARNRPRGSAAVRHLVGQDDGARSMLGITAEQVVAEWRELPKRDR